MNTLELSIPLIEQLDRPRAAATLRAIQSGELFKGVQEIVIHHEGQEYRLRITRQNKLILTK